MTDEDKEWCDKIAFKLYAERYPDRLVRVIKGMGKIFKFDSIDPLNPRL